MDAQLLSHSQLFVTPRTVAASGSSVHGIFQTRILEWVNISFSKGVEKREPSYTIGGNAN